MFEHYDIPVPDMEKYLERIGLTEAGEPSLRNLNRLIKHHQLHIPFENLDGNVYHKETRLEIDALFDKMVLRHRGGYCVEQNGLFCRVLKDLGYECYSAHSRVLTGYPGELPYANHRSTIVKLEGRRYIADVGFGGIQPMEALLLEDGYEADTPHGHFLIRSMGDEDWKESVIEKDGKIKDLIFFTDHPVRPMDFMLLSYYGSMNPDFHFVKHLILQIPREGGFVRVFDDAFIRLDRGEKTVHKIESKEELVRILKNEFGIAAAPEDFRDQC